MRGGRGGQGGSAPVGLLYGITEALIAILDVIAASYLWDAYAADYREANEKTWREAIEKLRPHMERIIAAASGQINHWQEDGRTVTLVASVQVTSEQSGPGGLELIKKVDLLEARLVAEGLEPPPKDETPSLGQLYTDLPGSLLRYQFMNEIKSKEHLEFVLEGTRADVRRLREIDERLASPGVPDDERLRLKAERDGLRNDLPENVSPPGPVPELSPRRTAPSPAPVTPTAREAAIAAKRAEVEGLQRAGVQNPEQGADTAARLRAARVELRLLELEKRRNGAFEPQRRAEVVRVLEDIVFYEWKADLGQISADERARLESLRNRLDEIASPP